MGHIWELIYKVNDLMKFLPDTVKEHAAMALKDMEQTRTEGVLLETVLTGIRDATNQAPPPIPPPRQHTPPKTAKTATTAKTTTDKTQTNKQQKKPTQGVSPKKQQTSTSPRGTSEVSVPQKVC
jgi:hypothetical protein